MGQADAPGLHPAPPHDLARRQLPLRLLHVEWYRVYRCARDPRFFGRTGQFRFDAPAAEYGVLYVARSHEGAFIETFGSVVRAQAGRNYLDEQTVHERCWATVTSERPLRLVDLSMALPHRPSSSWLESYNHTGRRRACHPVEGSDKDGPPNVWANHQACGGRACRAFLARIALVPAKEPGHL